MFLCARDLNKGINDIKFGCVSSSQMLVRTEMFEFLSASAGALTAV